MALLDASRTGGLPPLSPPADDAYAAWFNANSRCAAALRAWRAAGPQGRGAAYATYRRELDLEGVAAARLAHLHALRAS
jgi:hypothetical protein